MIDLEIVSALFLPGGYDYRLLLRAHIEDVSALTLPMVVCSAYQYSPTQWIMIDEEQCCSSKHCAE